MSVSKRANTQLVKMIRKDLKIYYNKSILKKNKNVKCLNRREGKLATTWKTKIKMKTKTEATKIK